MHTPQRRTITGATAILGLASTFCLAPEGVANSAGADCAKTVNFVTISPDAVSRDKGEHVVGEAQTMGGKIEARVSVTHGQISDPVLYLGGKRMRKTLLSKVPADIARCLGGEKSSAWLAGQKLAYAAPLRNLISPVDDAKYNSCWKITVSCSDSVGGGGVCCALAISKRTGASAVWCESY